MMLRKFSFFAILLFVALCSVTAFADQAAYITKAQAEKAAAFLKDKTEIKHYCEPCDDHSIRTEAIETVEVEHTGYQNYWQVKVNGVGIDLAYVYFNENDGKDAKKAKWRNLAMEMKIKVRDVPKKLPEEPGS